MPYRKEIKGIKYLQDRSSGLEIAQGGIASDLDAIKKKILAMDGGAEALDSARHRVEDDALSPRIALAHKSATEIFAEAEALYPGALGLGAILTSDDIGEVEQRIDGHILDFNRKYGLDRWDYAIAGGCGLFAAMLDILCVRAPLKPTTAWTQKVDGIFNQGVQKAFNALLPEDLSSTLSKKFPIGAPDTSVTSQLLGAPAKALNPTNHRLRSLAHDPVLGFLFGVLDMMRGTCTTVVNGEILVLTSTKGQTDGNVFQLLGRMCGHLLSDVNAPSAGGNRGMGLPAPFMGLLRMFESIPVGDSNFGRQIEWMYVNGYDFRQFAATSIPMAIMEAMVRAFYVAKQMKSHGASFGETMMDTMPGRLNPRFRIMLALAYGTSSTVNAGRMVVTKNILNANYASWLGLAWNGFHALKWALLDRQLKLWSEIEAKEITALENLVERMEALEQRAECLPIR